MPPEKYGELNIDEKQLAFCRDYNASTLFLNLQKESLMCRDRDTIQRQHPLWSAVNLTIL